MNVLLTTYDALKSTDMAISVDEQGHAILSTNGSGWMESRASSQAEQTTKQFSVLHKVNFQRVVFVDLLGRKSFLAKQGTARAAAAVALRANSRLVFFCQSEVDGGSAMLALKKSDKQATQSLSAILHLNERNDNRRDSYEDEPSDAQSTESQLPLETCTLDLKDLM